MSPFTARMQAGIVAGSLLLACSSPPPKSEPPVLTVHVYLTPDVEVVQITWGYLGTLSVQVEASIDGESIGTASGQVQSPVLIRIPGVPDASIAAFRARVLTASGPGPWGPSASIQLGVRAPSDPTIVASTNAFDVSWTGHAVVADTVRIERAWIRCDGTTVARPEVDLPGTAASYADVELAGWVDGAHPWYRLSYVRRGVASAALEFPGPTAQRLAPGDLAATVNGDDVTVTWTNRTACGGPMWILGWPYVGKLFAHERIPQGTSSYTVVHGVGLSRWLLSPDDYQIPFPPSTLEVLVWHDPVATFFDARIVEMPGSDVASGDPGIGWLLPGSWGYSLGVPGAWTWSPVQNPSWKASARTSARAALVYGIDTGTADVTGLWLHDSGLPSPDLKLDGNGSSGASLVAHGEELHGAWQSSGGARYSSSTLGWSPEDIPCAGVPVGHNFLSVGDDGVPMAVLSDGTGYQLATRTSSGWTCASVPETRRSYAPVLLARDASDAWLFDVVGDSDLLEVVWLSYGPSGWSGSTTLDQLAWGRMRLAAARSAAGRALVVTEDALRLLEPSGASTRILLDNDHDSLAGFEGERAWALLGFGVDIDAHPYLMLNER